MVFEPNEQSPRTIQVFGAFAYVDRGPAKAGATSPVQRGYLYFSNLGATPAVPKEWPDLRAAAVSGQAVGFGSWFYMESFASLKPDQVNQDIYGPAGGPSLDLRVHPEFIAHASPVPYASYPGIIRLSAEGSHAVIVRALKDALQR